ncbi:RHS repeat-associated core domain-containing protein [Dyella sp.]|uniref:RHS repeat-associated core domain-containing protein n=1 Tax=Dyella sp. TaxID=1869338 RepID=UPI0039C89D05
MDLRWQVEEISTYIPIRKEAVLAEADSSDGVVASYDYRPYALRSPGNAPNSVGRRVSGDTDSGLSYSQARYYDPVVERFLSGDPEPLQAGFTFEFNRSAYANDNPVKNVDLTG